MIFMLFFSWYLTGGEIANHIHGRMSQADTIPAIVQDHRQYVLCRIWKWWPWCLFGKIYWFWLFFVPEQKTVKGAMILKIGFKFKVKIYLENFASLPFFSFEFIWNISVSGWQWRSNDVPKSQRQMDSIGHHQQWRWMWTRRKTRSVYESV